MGRGRSERQAFFLALAAVGAAGTGWAAMSLVGALAVPLGLRPALLLAEATLAAPALLLAAATGGRVGLLGERGRPGLFWRALAAGAALWLLSLGLMDMQARVWSPPPGYLEMFRRLHVLLRPTGPADALFSMAVIALMPALCEELVFRGLLLPAFTAWRGAGVGLAASSVLFAAIHIDAVGAGGWTAFRVPFALVVGLGFGLLRQRSGTLLVPVLAHATLNTLTFAAVPLLDEPAQPAAFPNPALGPVLVSLGALAVARLLRGLTPAPAAPVGAERERRSPGLER